MSDVIDTILKILLAILALFGGKELISKVIFRFSKKEQNSYVAGSSGENVGRDKIVNYYFSSPGIGNSNDLLEGNEVQEKIVNFYEVGFKQLGISEEDINKISLLVYNLSRLKLDGLRPESYPAKGVTNDHRRHLRGAVFAFGSENYNEEWREHAASSIREMLSIFSANEDDFGKTLKDLFKKGAITVELFETIELSCSKIKKYYQFFTGVTHHQQAAITNGFRQLEDPTCENEKCLSVESFKRVFGSFFIDMKKIIENIPSV
ncbi:MAG: hypothetical protein G01um101413_701 [Parcubacteria group bacterium Gr01-1014_13]|nr:MAG: hypothetical protein G01um101413_701 [Parcubacteria group bacterium Gr01-1014_13]